MTVIGTGIDIVEIARMEALLARRGERFKNRVFLPNEQAYCESRAVPARHYAGRFAVKEAVAKAFGTGVGRHISWKDIEVRRAAESGSPSVVLGARAQRLAEERGVTGVLVSLAHGRHYAVAHALLIGKDAVREDRS